MGKSVVSLVITRKHTLETSRISATILQPSFGPNSKFLYDSHLSLFPTQVGKAEFLGRAIGKPNAILQEEEYKAPSLEWFQIHRGAEEAGELLAAFEMFEVRK